MLNDKFFADLKKTFIESQRRDLPEGRSRAERRAEARELALPADRRCPECEKVIIASRRWVIDRETGYACCLKCHRASL